MKLHSAKEKAGVKKKDKKQTQGDDDAWARVMGYAAELESPEPPSSPEPEPAQSKRNVEISAKDRDHLIQQFRAWANDKKAVAARMAKHDLTSKLSQGRPLVKISGFLPAEVADGALEVIRGCPDDVWESANADADAKQAARAYGAGSTGHEFDVGDGGGGSDMELLMEVVKAAMPARKLSTLQAARYRSGGYIEPHDDAAYADAMVDGKKTLCSREFAIIFYLTKDWAASDGGALIDHKQTPPKVLVPEFNSIVAFKVPRLHEVMPVTGNRPRFSIFGWFLAPGRLYKVKNLKEKDENPSGPGKVEAGAKGGSEKEKSVKRKAGGGRSEEQADKREGKKGKRDGDENEGSEKSSKASLAPKQKERGDGKIRKRNVARKKKKGGGGKMRALYK